MNCTVRFSGGESVKAIPPIGVTAYWGKLPRPSPGADIPDNPFKVPAKGGSKRAITYLAECHAR